eukprot:3350663-Rhodomonas_salina.8
MSAGYLAVQSGVKSGDSGCAELSWGAVRAVSVGHRTANAIIHASCEDCDANAMKLSSLRESDSNIGRCISKGKDSRYKRYAYPKPASKAIVSSPHPWYNSSTLALVAQYARSVPGICRRQIMGFSPAVPPYDRCDSESAVPAYTRSVPDTASHARRHIA